MDSDSEEEIDPILEEEVDIDEAAGEGTINADLEDAETTVVDFDEPLDPEPRLTVRVSIRTGSSDWTTLGTVEDIDTGASFIIPSGVMATQEDLANAEVAIETLSDFSESETFFIDAAWFYLVDSMEEVNQPTIPDVIPETEVLVEEINLNPHPDEYCEVDPFTVDVSASRGGKATVHLAGLVTGPHSIQVGSVPPGFKVFFPNGESRYELPFGEVAVDIIVRRRSNLDPVNLSVPMVLTNEADGQQVICQLNLVR